MNSLKQNYTQKFVLEEIDNCIITNDKDLKVTFKKELRAITPGQYIVFYNNKNECLGSGYIKK